MPVIKYSERGIGAGVGTALAGREDVPNFTNPCVRLGFVYIGDVDSDGDGIGEAAIGDGDC